MKRVLTMRPNNLIGGLKLTITFIKTLFGKVIHFREELV
jgi:hypothetical protein